MYIDLNAQVRTQQAHHLESVCNLGGGGEIGGYVFGIPLKKQVYSTWNFSCGLGVDLHVDIK